MPGVLDLLPGLCPPKRIPGVGDEGLSTEDPKRRQDRVACTPALDTGIPAPETPAPGETPTAQAGLAEEPP